VRVREREREREGCKHTHIHTHTRTHTHIHIMVNPDVLVPQAERLRKEMEGEAADEEPERRGKPSRGRATAEPGAGRGGVRYPNQIPVSSLVSPPRL